MVPVLCLFLSDRASIASGWRTTEANLAWDAHPGGPDREQRRPRLMPASATGESGPASVAKTLQSRHGTLLNVLQWAQLARGFPHRREVDQHRCRWCATAGGLLSLCIFGGEASSASVYVPEPRLRGPDPRRAVRS